MIEENKLYVFEMIKSQSNNVIFARNPSCDTELKLILVNKIENDIVSGIVYPCKKDYFYNYYYLFYNYENIFNEKESITIPLNNLGIISIIEIKKLGILADTTLVSDEYFNSMVADEIKGIDELPTRNHWWELTKISSKQKNEKKQDILISLKQGYRTYDYDTYIKAISEFLNDIGNLIELIDETNIYHREDILQLIQEKKVFI